MGLALAANMMQWIDYIRFFMVPAEGLLGPLRVPRPCGVALPGDQTACGRLSNPLVVCRGFESTRRARDADKLQ